MYNLQELAQFIDAELVGDASVDISGVASAVSAKNNQLTYVVSQKYKSELVSTQAGVVILNHDLLKDCPTNALIVDDVYLAFASVFYCF